MSVTVEQIVDETSKWPEDAVAELVDRIMLAKYGSHLNNDDSWMHNARRRVDEIRSGGTHGISGDAVTRKICEIVGK